MLDEYTLKHLYDIKCAIDELESFFADYPNRFDVFEKDRLRICAVERKTEIMGEAINRILKHNPEINIPHSKEIIATRNRIIHCYDGVETEFLWGLVIRHIPQLKKDINALLSDESEKKM